MKRTSLLAISLSAAALLLSALPLHAQEGPVSTLNVTLTLMVQNPDEIRGTATTQTTNATVARVRVTNKDLLHQMGAPSGATLVSLGSNQLGYKFRNQIVPSSEVSITDVFSNGNGTSVDAGKEVETMGKSFRSSITTTTYGTVSAAFGAGIGVGANQIFDFTMTGIQTDRNNLTEDLIRNTFTFTSSFSMTGAGTASLNANGEPARAVLTGSIRGSGRQTGSLVTPTP